MIRIFIAGACLFTALAANAADTNTLEQLLTDSRKAIQEKKLQEALAFLARAIEKDPQNPQSVFLRGVVRENQGRWSAAIADYTRAIELSPGSPSPWQQRGSVYFKAGQFTNSVADFDRYLQLVPSRAAEHWQRGIACYYAGEFAKGQKQFELHQTVNPNDVENAVWHYLCVARQQGADKAKAGLLPIEGDRRVPLMEIYHLFQGRGTEAQIFAAVKKGSPSIEEENTRLFYAHLYLALYAEAAGDKKKTIQHLQQAVTKAPADNYMSDVARVHLQLVSRQKG